MLHLQNAAKKPTKHKTEGREQRERWLKKPAWLATAAAEYHGGQEASTGDEVDELETGEEENDHESGVKVRARTSFARLLTSVLARRVFEGQGEVQSLGQEETKSRQG